MSSRLPPKVRRVPTSLQGLSALELFRAGFDTVDLMAHFMITEAEALKQVSSQRSAALDRSNPYVRHSRPAVREVPLSRSGRVAYAGRE